MIDYQQLEKNRIRFPAKIRTKQCKLNKDLFNKDGSTKKFLRLATSQSLGTLETNSNNFIQPQLIPSSTKFASTPVASRSIKLLDQSQWLKTSFNKNNFLVLTPDISRISKDEQTKGSQFGDFGDLSQNMTLHSFKHCDNSFDESNKIISIFQSKQQNQITHDSLFYQRMIEEKNNQINILVQNSNQQRKLFQSRIMQLQFQNMIQKRKSSQIFDSVINLERICGQQQNQIKRLQNLIFNLNEEKNYLILEHYNKQSELLGTISELNSDLCEYQKQVENLRINFEKQISQNNLLKEFVDSLQNEKLHLHLEFLELKMVYENEKQKNKIEKRNSKQEQKITKTNSKIILSESLDKNNKHNQKIHYEQKVNNSFNIVLQQKQQQELFDQDKLQNEEEDQEQVFQYKNKTNRRKNVIKVLQNKIKNLQQQLDCTDATNYTLFETNQQMMSLALKQLCDKLQRNNMIY